MRVCREINQWITEQIEQPVERWAQETERRCVEQDCNWWCLCCNKWFCFLVTILVRIIVWVVVTITRLVTTVVCEVIGLILDVVALVVNLVLSIPILGGIIRTVLNWATEIFWRVVGLPDLILTAFGIQLPKKIYMKVVILNNDGRPLTTEAAVLPFVADAQTIFRAECNINLIHTGTCVPTLNTPQEARTISCDVSGFFADWWVGGSYFELVSADCAFKDGWRRVVGYGAELIVFVIGNVTPDAGGSTTIGCSMGPTHNYVVVEAASMGATAHELAHACGLWHIGDVNNLMNPNLLPTSRQLDRGQRVILRNSRHCVFI